MSENNIVVQVSAAPEFKKLMFNGVAATAQQVYDAFMAGPVRGDLGDGEMGTLIYLYWENSDGTRTNPKAVTYVEALLLRGLPDGSITTVPVSAGTAYVLPE